VSAGFKGASVGPSGLVMMGWSFVALHFGLVALL
jgi:hypothetical protein